MPRSDEENLFQDTTMTFGEHLEELRACLFKALFGLMIGFGISLFVAQDAVEFIQEPLKEALEKFHKDQAPGRLKEARKEMRDLGFRDDGLSADMVDQIATEGLVPEIIFVSPRALLRMQKEAHPEQFRSTPLVQHDPDEDSDPDLLRPIIIHHKAEKEVRITSLGVHEAFSIWIKAAVVMGILLASPWIFYQIWAFVAAGLYPHERKYIHVFLPFSLGLFFAGASLAFFFVFGPVLKFLFMFNDMMKIAPDMRITDWLSFVLILPLGFGVSFQLPLVMLFLERIGIFDVHAYLTKWRMAILVIAVTSMMLTPADPTSMMMMAVPLTFLYFLGILLCKWMPKNRSPFDDKLDDAKQDEKKELSDEARRERFWLIMRLILVAILVVVFFAWGPIQEARQQKAAVAEIGRLGGKVVYRYQLDDSGKLTKKTVPPGWGPLHKLLGKDMFIKVVQVDLSGTKATNDTLETLQELPGLKRLNVKGTKVTADGVKQFRKALTKCKVVGP